MELTASSMGMDNAYFLIGMLNRFNNEFQCRADAAFADLSWKQLFFLNCVALFEEDPTIKDMADLIGCSHQNAKQILLKLEKRGLIEVYQDKGDRRKLRMRYTAKADKIRRDKAGISEKAMNHIFNGVDDNELEIAVKVICQLEENLHNMEL